MVWKLIMVAVWSGWTWRYRLASGDILQIAVDGATGKVWFGRNGTYFKTPSTNDSGTTGGLDAAGTNEIGTITNTDGKPLFIVVGGNSATVHVNFGQDGTFSGTTTAGGNADGNGHGNFKYAVSSGFLSLCSSNLPNPAEVVDPLEGEQASDYFVTTLYTGTNVTNEKNIGFAPDLLWFKHRNGGSDHVIYDSIRGANSGLVPNSPNGQNTTANSSQDLMSFDNDGFTVGVGSQFGSVNSPGHTIAVSGHGKVVVLLLVIVMVQLHLQLVQTLTLDSAWYLIRATVVLVLLLVMDLLRHQIAYG